MNNGIQDYIIERLQEVQIAQNKERTYSQVVQGINDIDNDTLRYGGVDSDEETYVISNKSITSKESIGSITETSQQSIQIKMIFELQEAIKEMKETQNRLIDHIQDLEDSVLALTENDENSVEFKKAYKLAEKIKKKKQPTNYPDDMIVEEKKTKGKRRSQWLTILARKKRHQEYIYPQKTSNIKMSKTEQKVNTKGKLNHE